MTADRENRCLAIQNDHQCTRTRVEGSDYCAKHGATTTLRKAEKKEIYKFKQIIWAERLHEFSADENIVSLREEVGMLRLLLETHMNSCTDDHELLLQSGPISDLIIKIKSTVESFHKMDEKLGNLLDKQAVLTFAAAVIDIIGVELAGDEVKMNTIADKIMEKIGASSDESR